VATRALHRARTRSELAAAALALFQARGFDTTTVEEVAAAAGVSRRTFFRYFPSKQHAFFAEHLARLASFRAGMRARAERGGWKAAVEALLEVAAAYQADPVTARAHHAILVASPELQKEDLRLDGEWERAIREELMAAGDDTFTARLRAGALMGVTRAILAAWFDDPDGADLVATGRAALDRLGRGLSA